MARSNVTTDHDEIRSWTEERGGRPACVRGTGGKGDPGMIRIDFPGYSGEDTLQKISWDRWFRAFDDNGLAFVFQDGKSRFNKLVSRDNPKIAGATGGRKKKKAGSTRSRTASTAKKAAGSGTTGRRKKAAATTATGRRKTATASASRAAGTSKAASTRSTGAKKKTTTRSTTARTTAAKKSTGRTTGAKKGSTRAAAAKKKATSRSRSSAVTTTDHDEIRNWVESRGGYPASVKRTSRGGDPGLLRIDYPGFSGARSLKPIDWDDFFGKFDDSGLAFLYEPSGESRFSKFVKRPSGRASRGGRR